MSESTVTGTKEWAESNFNFIRGCQHGCLYCFSKAFAVRFKRLRPSDWEHAVVNHGKLHGHFSKREGRVMFPSAHDIHPDNLKECLKVIDYLLSAGNELLIVSKAHFSCFEAICKEFNYRRDKIHFRITIGSADNEVLRYWEPGAPSFDDRLRSLCRASLSGYATSVSCEPMLDEHIEAVIDRTRLFVSDSIWLGKANRLKTTMKMNGHTSPEDIKRMNDLLKLQSDWNIFKLYDRYKDDPLIRWKDSIKKVVGLPALTRRGEDR